MGVSNHATHLPRVALRGALALMVILVMPATVLADHSWGTYHWARTSNPFSLKVGNNMTGDWPTYYNAAIGDWNTPTNNKSAVLNLVPTNGSSGKVSSR